MVKLGALIKSFLIIGILLCTCSYVDAQHYITWQDGGTFVPSSNLDSIVGYYPGGIVTATTTGSGNEIRIGMEDGIDNLNGAIGNEIFATKGAADNAPSKSLTFTFSNPVVINSFNMHDIDKGPTWDDGFVFSGVIFDSVATGGGLTADTFGTLFVPGSTGYNTEYANWFNSKDTIESFSLDYHNTNGLTHWYLGYSINVTAVQVGIVAENESCSGDSVLLTAINDSIHYWATTVAPHDTLSSDSFIYVFPEETTTYIVFGSEDTAYHTVHIINLTDELNLGNDTTICPDDKIVLDAYHPNAASYQWKQQFQSQRSTYQVISPGFYWVTVFGKCDTSFTDTITVSWHVMNLPNDTIFCLGQELTVGPRSPSTPLYYYWQDRSTEDSFTITEPGTYWVELDYDNCQLRDSMTVEMEECEIILEIPNVFSPNGDLSNNLFKPIISKGIESVHTEIYSRWGRLVFRSDHLNIEWTGEDCSDDVYYWIVNYTDRLAVSKTLKGTVTLLR